MRRIHFARIGQVIALGFGLILGLALLTGILGLIAYEISLWQRETIRTRGEVDRLTLELEIISIRRTAALRRFLSSGNVTILASSQTYQLAYADINSRLVNLLATPQELQALQGVQQAEAAYRDKEEEILSLYRNGFEASARFLWDNEGLVAQDALLEAIEQLRLAQGNASAMLVSQARQTERMTVLAISIFVPLMLIGGVVTGIVITRKITHPISDLVDGVTVIGNDLTKRVTPSGPEEIAFLGETVNQMADNLLSSRQSLQAYKDRLQQELRLASQIQASFLPAVLPQLPDLELAVYWQSAREVAGDFYAFIDLGEGKRGLAIGDVSGKGAPAAMTGTLAEGLLEVYAPFHIKPETLLAALNKDLTARLAPNHMNVACCYAILDDVSGLLTVANAGCIHPYLRRGYEVQEIEIGGLPLGSTTEFTYTSLSMPVKPGDLIIFSSDGLVEAMNDSDEMFGFDRLQTELQSLPIDIDAQGAVDRLVKKVMAFTNHIDLHDDLTILAARVVGNHLPE